MEFNLTQCLLSHTHCLGWAGMWDLGGTVWAVTLVAHLNAKLINRVWDFLFVSPFFMFMFLTRARDEISIYNSLSSPGMFGWVFFFFTLFCCSDDKVSHLEFYLISEDEKELKGGWAHLTLSRILQKEDEWLGKGSCPSRAEFIPGSELHPGFSFTWGDHPADPTDPSLLSWGMAFCPGCSACLLETLCFQSSQV